MVCLSLKRQISRIIIIIHHRINKNFTFTFIGFFVGQHPIGLEIFFEFVTSPLLFFNFGMKFRQDYCSIVFFSAGGGVAIFGGLAKGL